VARFWRVIDRQSADPDSTTVSRGSVAAQWARNINQCRFDQAKAERHVVGSRRKLGYLIVDVHRAAEPYAAGWTLRRIDAELGVDHSTVAYRLDRASLTLRRGGARRHDVDTQHILDLRDQGMTMAAIGALGMSLKGVWARYYRARPAKRAVPSASPAPIRMISRQKVLINARFEHDVIGVGATVIAHLGHEPDWAEQSKGVDGR
jgi:hypothetical protein